jgi:hypothetical protein
VARSVDWRIERASSALAGRTVRAPAIEILHFFGQHSTQWRSLKMNTWSRHSPRSDLTQRSSIEFACGDLNGVRIWVSPRLLTRWFKERHIARVEIA